VVVLLALVIVAWLAKDALTKYGLVPDMETVQKQAGAPPGRAPATDASSTDPTAVTPAPANPLEAARNLQKSLQQESEKRGGGY
jgi:F420-0:gamma-glutamyl ligase